ncbi:hypothetical protein [Kineococcus radiotolerans]|uniref:Phosphoesterase PA-phosphatase related n=1 Tax=Kineococcus radiotolerans (strain ATCC BAA-149 / DSM 14245 / SRS30216) TaxID=266940 RepID=A6WBZ8_KINRD|nr:hypothetical protein [Kineococcus radiotolerans]ABS04337.1 conserved hypothetical protein [Kineococcus radiotolerans SRS30216 = ATCC BAA-149]
MELSPVPSGADVAPDLVGPVAHPGGHPGGPRREALARLVSEVTSPPRVMALVQTLVAFDSCTTTRRAVGLSAWTAGTTALLPDLFVRWGAARGHWSDREVSRRHQRTVPILFGLVSCAVGLTGLHLLDAPDAMTAAVWAPIAAVPAFLAVNHSWTKLSLHVGCLAGGVVLTTATHGPAVLLAGVPALVATAWSRRELGHHTVGQLLLGGVIGAGTTAAVHLALR